MPTERGLVGSRRPPTDLGLPVALSGVVVPLAGLKPAVEIDQLALAQMQTSG